MRKSNALIFPALALLLTICAIVATAAYAEYSGSDAQRTTTDAILYGLPLESVQARRVAITYGLQWPACEVGTGRRDNWTPTPGGNQIKVFQRCSGD